jgi:DnaJ-class molecular chaperone
LEQLLIDRKKTPAEILGIPPDATVLEAKNAWKRLALHAHPDRPGGSMELFKMLGRALQEHCRAIPCSTCQNTGKVTIRTGLASRQEPCPTCWKKE